MNDETMIWERYENMKKPWDENMALRDGVILKGLSIGELSEYLDLLDSSLNEEANKLTINYPVPRSDDPDDWVEGKSAEDKDIDNYLKSRFNFSLKDFEELSKSDIKGNEDYEKYFRTIGIDIWVKSILNSVSRIVEYDLNEDDGDYEEEWFRRNRIKYNPYDR